MLTPAEQSTIVCENAVLVGDILIEVECLLIVSSGLLGQLRRQICTSFVECSTAGGR